MPSNDDRTTVGTVLPPLSNINLDNISSCLVEIHGNSLGKRYNLEEEAYIGRGEENTIKLDMDTVSRSHALISRRMYGQYEVEDLMSTNGTYVNDILINERAPLKHKDRLKIGQTVFRFISGQNLETLYYQEVYDCFVRDGLTSSYKQHYLVDTLMRDMERCKHHQRPLCLAILAIDDFIGITDDMGRMAADDVLRQVSERLQGVLQPEEMVARAHGEFFDIIFPEYTIDQAVSRLQKIRELLETQTYGFEDDAFQITLSIAVQQYDPNKTPRGPSWVLSMQENCRTVVNSGGAAVKAF